MQHTQGMRCSGARLATAALVLLLASPATAGAQEGRRKPDQPAMEAPNREPPWRNRVSGYVGALFEEGAGTALTLGAEYEWRFHEWYGIGAYADFVTGGHRSLLLGPAFNLHPVGGLGIMLAPSAERANNDWFFAFRLGFEYEFEVRNRWAVAPTLALDFARGERLLLVGATVGWLF